jgi:hypothetical protein
MNVIEISECRSATGHQLLTLEIGDLAQPLRDTAQAVHTVGPNSSAYTRKRAEVSTRSDNPALMAHAHAG